MCFLVKYYIYSDINRYYYRKYYDVADNNKSNLFLMITIGLHYNDLQFSSFGRSGGEVQTPTPTPSGTTPVKPTYECKT